MENEVELYIPEYDEFLDKLYSLNPVGKADMYYTVMKDKLGTQLYNKEILTFEILIKRYSDYLSYLKPFNDIKGIGEYLVSGDFQNDYSHLQCDANDFYLFGI